MADMADGQAIEDKQTITYGGRDIEELPPETLREALRLAFRDLTAFEARLSEEGKEAAAREEDFQRTIVAHREYYGAAADFQSRLVNASTAYNQIIVLGAYAGFFGIWSAVAKDIPPMVRLTSAALMTLSLIIYVGWTVAGMFLTHNQNISVLATFVDGVEGFEDRYRAAVAKGHGRITKLQGFWKAVVASAGLSGLVAAIMVGGAALWATIDLPAVKTVPDLATVAAVASAKAAARDADCSAKTVAFLTQAQTGPGTRAINPTTGEHAVLIGKKWVILPKCGGISK